MMPAIKISRSEMIIMNLVKQGLTNQKISSELEISVNTVKYHLKNLYKKFGVSNRVEVINRYNELTQNPMDMGE